MGDDQFRVNPNVTPDSPAPRREAPRPKPAVNPFNTPPNLKLGQPFARSRWPGVAWFTGTWKTKKINKEERRQRLAKDTIREPGGKVHEPTPVVVRVVNENMAGEVYMSWYNNETRKVKEGNTSSFLIQLDITGTLNAWEVVSNQCQ